MKSGQQVVAKDTGSDVKRPTSIWGCTLCPNFKTDTALITTRKKNSLSVQRHIIDKHPHVDEDNMPAFINLWGLRFWHNGGHQDIQRSFLESHGAPSHYSGQLNLKSRAASFLKRFKTADERQQSATPEPSRLSGQVNESKAVKEEDGDKKYVDAVLAWRAGVEPVEPDIELPLKPSRSNTETNVSKPKRKSKAGGNSQNQDSHAVPSITQPSSKRKAKTVSANHDETLALCHQSAPWSPDILARALAEGQNWEPGQGDVQNEGGYPLMRPLIEPGYVDRELLEGKCGKHLQQLAEVVFDQKYRLILTVSPILMLMSGGRHLLIDL